MSTTIELDAEKAGRTLPPGPRDWLAYRLVKVQQLTTREAAKELGISQTRVCQLIDRVVEYMIDVAPGCESPEARGRRLYIAESVAAERIDFLLGQVWDRFQKSIGPQRIVRQTQINYGPPKTTESTRDSNGDARLATAAARLAAMGGKMPANTLIATMPADVLPEDEFCEVNHPNEDCSAMASEPVVTPTERPKEVVATAVATDVCKTDAVGEAMLKVLNSRPVQPMVWSEPPGDLSRDEKMRRAIFLGESGFFDLANEK